MRWLRRLHPIFLSEVQRHRPTCHLEPPKTSPGSGAQRHVCADGAIAPLVNLETVSGPIISISALVSVNIRGEEKKKRQGRRKDGKHTWIPETHRRIRF